MRYEDLAPGDDVLVQASSCLLIIEVAKSLQYVITLTASSL